ncbi:MAG: zinc metalloprotease HtpX [Ilumatobacter sp.]|uniref:zinc metalloprotease HtpX n=1 Tax=Ilumatobacter sp. TaxID=1967498 RepID=UPI0026044A19|nr:zinc metalloprotease HtpX [Ilumatobacter sp.]MDJ0768393.1 zinc metalloprotease HtpX [Ilumatobacter sp.]
MFKNTMKTGVLLAGLGGLIIAVSGILGGGSSASLTIGLVLALVMVGGSYWFSDKLALRSAKAQVITREQAPEFYGMVEQLAQRANMPMPTVAVSPDAQPNAFATGRGPKNAVVCATQGLLETLPRDEVEGVMAHELMHVKHRDILIGSVAAAIATAISFMAQMAMFSSMFGGRDRRSGNPIAMLAVALLAPIAASLIQMAVSRSREYEADRGAAELLGSGEPLARALQRIEAIAAQRPMAVQPAQAQAYIHNPLAEARSSRGGGPNMAKLFSTHPPTDERIRRLLTI